MNGLIKDDFDIFQNASGFIAILRSIGGHHKSGLARRGCRFMSKIEKRIQIPHRKEEPNEY